MSSLRRFLFLAAIVCALDQASKALVLHALSPTAYIPLAGRVLGIRLAANEGAAFSLFASRQPLLIALTFVAIGAILYYAQRAEKLHPWMVPALALQLGGALGNLVDRLRLGHVTDFIYVSFWPTFNVADSAITIGVALLAYCLLMEPAPQELPACEGKVSQ